MNQSLYSLAEEYREAAERLADLDLDDQTIADTLEGLAGTLEVKATNVAMFAKNLEVTAAAIKEAESNMAKRRKAIEARAERVYAYLKQNMEAVGMTKIESPYLRIAIRNNPAAVHIDAESQIPPEFWKQSPPPPPALDKKAIANAIKSGREVPGAHMEADTRLEVR